MFRKQQGGAPPCPRQDLPAGFRSFFLNLRVKNREPGSPRALGAAPSFFHLGSPGEGADVPRLVTPHLPLQCLLPLKCQFRSVIVLTLCTPLVSRVIPTTFLQSWVQLGLYSTCHRLGLGFCCCCYSR